MPECYIRGSTIKYLRIPDEVIDMVKEESAVKNRGRDMKAGRGGAQNQRNRPAARGEVFCHCEWKCLMCYVFLGNFGRGAKVGGNPGRGAPFQKQKGK